MADRTSTRGLSPDESERVRAKMRELLSRCRNQCELADRLGVSQQSISSVLAGDTVGPKIARAVAREVGLTFDDLIGAAPPAEVPAEADPYPGRRELRARPEFAAAPPEVQREIVSWHFSGGDRRSLLWWLFDLRERVEAHAAGVDPLASTTPIDPKAQRAEKTPRRR